MGTHGIMNGKGPGGEEGGLGSRKGAGCEEGAAGGMFGGEQGCENVRWWRRSGMTWRLCACVPERREGEGHGTISRRR